MCLEFMLVLAGSGPFRRRDTRIHGFPCIIHVAPCCIHVCPCVRVPLGERACSGWAVVGLLWELRLKDLEYVSGMG